MKNATDKKAARKHQLAAMQRKIVELTADSIMSHNLALQSLSTFAKRDMLASGVIVQVTYLGGKEAVSTVLIQDGLSKETIAALRADIMRSLQIKASFIPKVTE